MRDVLATDTVRPARYPWQHLRALVISDPVLAKDLFNSTSADLIERPTFGSGTLGDTFGPFGRLFAGAPGALMSEELQRGRLSYRMYHFIKD